MITHSFDPHSLPVFGPEDLYPKQEKLADICIITFSCHHQINSRAFSTG